MELWWHCLDMKEKTVDLRREFHRIPEYGRTLPKTRAVVCRELERMGISYTLNPYDDGLFATIQGQPGGPCIAFRADMDALQVQEQTGLPYASEHQGYMHACGHDAHVAMLLSAAEVLQSHRKSFYGRVRLMFESGEETGTGSDDMIAAGGLQGVDAVLGLHIGNITGPEVPSGTFVVKPGACTAAKDRITLVVRGKGCHGAQPNEGVDPILIAARIVLSLQNLHDELPPGTPAVLTFGSFHSGEGHNVIPETAVLKGSLRTQDKKIRDYIVQRVEEIAVHTAQAFRGTCEVVIQQGSSVVNNDAKLAARVAKALRFFAGADRVLENLPGAMMGSDDFALYMKNIPGVYYFLSTADVQLGTDVPHHNERFDIDERQLWVGAASIVSIVEELCTQEQAIIWSKQHE